MTENNNNNHAGAIIWAVIGLIYAISPIDIVPDVLPIAGWMDDIAIIGATMLNLVQSYVKDSNEALAKIIGMLKWIAIILGTILTLVLALIALLVYKIVV